MSGALEIEPWQLYPMPPEQVAKIRGYVEQRERLAAERAVRYLTVYVVMVCDRHDDPDPRLFTDRGAALAEAERAAEEIGCAVQSPPDGWLFLADHEEGDAVWVLEKELDGEEA